MTVRVCHICGKEFFLSPENIYKARIQNKIKHFCSYGCYRELQKEKDAKKSNK